MKSLILGFEMIPGIKKNKMMQICHSNPIYLPFILGLTYTKLKYIDQNPQKKKEDKITVYL